MLISEYLNEIRYAVETVLGEIHRERQVVDRLEKELKLLIAATEDGYNRAGFLALNPDLDDEGLGTAIHWATYFGPDKKRHYKADELKKAKEVVEAHRLSISAMAGSILEYARQGIALRYGKDLKGCPDGRIIADMPLHEVIWQGRNQAIHWEEGKFREPVEKCFQKLAQIDLIYTEFTARSMAYDVVRLLDWHSFDKFAKDMRLLE